MSVERDGAIVRVGVRDDGVGFVLPSGGFHATREGGFGLFSIQERLARLGGSFSMHASAQFVSRMLEAGASGYLLKDSAYEELVQAIKALFLGQVYLSRGITGVVVEDYVRRAALRRRERPT